MTSDEISECVQTAWLQSLQDVNPFSTAKNQFECAPLPRTVISPPGDYYDEVTFLPERQNYVTVL